MRSCLNICRHIKVNITCAQHVNRGVPPEGLFLLFALQFSKQLCSHFAISYEDPRKAGEIDIITDAPGAIDTDTQRRPITCPGSYNWLRSGKSSVHMPSGFWTISLLFSHEGEKSLMSKVSIVEDRGMRLHHFQKRWYSLEPKAPCCAWIFV